ncbi:MAG TPA: helix-turn-helix domain-containing protein, partial [Gaiellaceae bacterium]
AADLLERRWTVSILYVSHEGAVRFNEFQQALGTIPPATLAQRLTDLEKAGVFERAVIDDRPPRVEYRLTRRGRQLRSLVNALTRFAETGVGTRR